VNYTRNRERFYNHLTFYPLSTDSKITHYVSLTTHMGFNGSPESNAAMPQPAALPPQQGTSQPLDGQAQLMSQSMVLPGAESTPLIGGSVIQGGTTMPRPPLAFLAPQVAMP
jgi:hypothetical protein